MQRSRMAHAGLKRQFRLLHQHVCISHIDIAECRLFASTELEIEPLNNSVDEICLNALHLQIVSVRVKNSPANSVTVRYRYPLTALLSSSGGVKDRNIPQYQHLLRRAVDESDADEGHGEVILNFGKPLAEFSISHHAPPQIADDNKSDIEAASVNTRSWKTLTLVIEYIIPDDRGGVRFVNLPVQQQQKRNVQQGAADQRKRDVAHIDDNHAYTVGPTRSWVPCVDSYSEPCLWTFSFNVTAIKANSSSTTATEMDTGSAATEAHTQTTPAGSSVALAPGTLVSDTFDSVLESRKFVYSLQHPTAAPNVGWAIGPFVSLRLIEIPRFAFWCLRPLADMVLIAATYLQLPLSFFRNLLDFELPLGVEGDAGEYRFVFVHHSSQSVLNFHGLAVVDNNLLFHHGVLEPQMESRIALAEAVAAQYFGGYLTCLRWSDSAWLFEGMAQYMTLQFVKMAFGTNEYKYRLLRSVQRVNDYDRQVCTLILANRNAADSAILLVADSIVDNASTNAAAASAVAGADPHGSTSTSSNLRRDTDGGEPASSSSLSRKQRRRHQQHAAAAAGGAASSYILSKADKQLLSGIFYNPWSPTGISDEYARMRCTKAGLIIHHVADKLGPTSLLSVIKKALTLARPGFNDIHERYLRCYSCDTFFSLVRDTHGRAILPLIARWVYNGNSTRLKIKFQYLKRGNSIELTIEQKAPVGAAVGLMPFSGKNVNSAGTKSKRKLRRNGTIFRGSIPVTMQEIDGATSHTINVDSTLTGEVLGGVDAGSTKQVCEIACSCKFRKLKRKKVLLSDGQEADVNLEKIRDECPVLWMRLDPEITVIHDIQLEMPDIIWQNMLLNEKCVIAQLRSIQALSDYGASYETVHVLLRCVENVRNYYRVRQAAADALVGVINKLTSEKKTEIPGGMLSLYQLYRQSFCLKLPPQPTTNSLEAVNTSTAGAASTAMWIIKPNEFYVDYAAYYLQCSLLRSLASLRDATGHCPKEVMRLLLDVAHYMDDSRNRFTSSYYKAACINALVESISHTTMHALSYGYEELPNIPVERLPWPVVDIMAIVVRALNMDMALPSHNYIITCTCFRAMVRLVKMRFMSSAQVNRVLIMGLNPVHFRSARLAAIECWMELQKLDVEKKSSGSSTTTSVSGGSSSTAAVEQHEQQTVSTIPFNVVLRDIITNSQTDPMTRAAALGLLSSFMEFSSAPSTTESRVDRHGQVKHGGGRSGGGGSSSGDARAMCWSRYNTATLANQIWYMMTSVEFACQPLIRSEAIRLYYKLYKNKVPEVLTPHGGS